LGDLLQIEGGTPVEQSFSINQPVVWNIKVDSNMAAEILFKEIRKLNAESKGLLEAGIMGEQKESVAAPSVVARQQKTKTPAPEPLRLSMENNNQFALIDDQLSGLFEELSSLMDSSNVTVSKKHPV
jgi:hypothetical protein